MIFFSFGYLGVKPTVVSSGSMQPALHIGDIAIVKKVRLDELNTGDIIQFISPYDNTTMFIHRIIDIENDSGRIFYITKGDFKEARRWLGKAAKQDNSNAMCLLGDLYYHGQGVEKDFNKAMKIYKLAVMLKNPLASYQLGTMYYNGHGISVNYAEALRLFKQGGKRGKATLNQICNASPEFCKQYQQ